MENKKNNGKTVYKIVLTIITVACIITGVVLHLGNWFSSHRTFNWNGINWKEEEVGESVDYLDDIEAFSELKVSVDIGDVTVKEGKTFSVDYQYPEKYVPEFSVTNNKLTLTQKTPNGLGMANTTAWNDVYVTITIPSGTKLDKVDINSALGEIDVSDLEGKTLEITDSLGDIKVKNCSFENYDIENSLGNVTLTDVMADDIETNLSMGDMKFEDVEASGKITCENSMGDIHFEGEARELKFDDSMGDIKVETKSDWTGKLDTDMGEVYVNGQHQGNTYTR